jgi:hypothetical protein
MTSKSESWKSNFLSVCLDNDILKFGSFKLKSGRISPYFFNTALFHRADLVLALATAYAQALISHTPALDFTVLFGVKFPSFSSLFSASHIHIIRLFKANRSCSTKPAYKGKHYYKALKSLHFIISVQFKKKLI